MTARLEASVKTASAKEAEAAAAGKAEQAALQAAEHARQQSCAAVAAATGAQPHLSYPGFQPFPQHERPTRLPEQQVRQEFEGQKLLNSAMGTLPLTSHRHGLVPENNRGHSASHVAVRPSRDCSPSTYATRMRDMQDHIEALTLSLSQNRQSSPKRQRGQKVGRHSTKDKHQADERKKRRPRQPPVQLASKRLDTLDLFDSEDALSSSGRSYGDAASPASESTSDRYAHVQLHVCSNTFVACTHHCTEAAFCTSVNTFLTIIAQSSATLHFPCQHVIRDLSETVWTLLPTNTEPAGPTHGCSPTNHNQCCSDSLDGGKQRKRAARKYQQLQVQHDRLQQQCQQVLQQYSHTQQQCSQMQTQATAQAQELSTHKARSVQPPCVLQMLNMWKLLTVM